MRVRAAIIRRDGSVQRLELESIASDFQPFVAASRSSWLIVGGGVTSGFDAPVTRDGTSGRFSGIDPFPIDLVSDGARFLVLSPQSVTLVDRIGNGSRNGMPPPFHAVGLGADANGYLITDGQKVQRLDHDANGIGRPLTLGATGTSATRVRDGWLVWARVSGKTFIEHVNVDATAVIEPPVTIDGEMLQVAATNDDGSVTAVFSTVVDDPRYGFGSALVVRDIVPKQRHAAR